MNEDKEIFADKADPFGFLKSKKENEDNQTDNLDNAAQSSYEPDLIDTNSITEGQNSDDVARDEANSISAGRNADIQENEVKKISDTDSEIINKALRINYSHHDDEAEMDSENIAAENKREKAKLHKQIIFNTGTGQAKKQDNFLGMLKGLKAISSERKGKI